MRSEQLKQSIYATIFVCTLVLAPLSSSGAAKNTFGQQIFNLQKKQAEKGNTLAQFKLGTFYEYGISVEKNSAVAKIWYIKAAKKKYTPAQDRLTYLDIKERGYNEYAHAEWFKKVSNKAKKEKANSLIILGQMYHNGIIVKKNLPMAFNFLRRASLKSHAEIDGEIAEVRSKIEAEKKATPVEPAAEKKIVTTEKLVSPPQKKTRKSTRKTTKKNIKKTTQTNKKKRYSKSGKTSKNIAKESSRAEKERRYKEVMWKIHQETMLLEQTQHWSEDEEDEDLQ